MEIEELRTAFEAKFKRDVPVNKKNDKDWIIEKLEEVPKEIQKEVKVESKYKTIKDAQGNVKKDAQGNVRQFEVSNGIWREIINKK